jgi:hypothetical protein
LPKTTWWKFAAAKRRPTTPAATTVLEVAVSKSAGNCRRVMIATLWTATTASEWRPRSESAREVRSAGNLLPKIATR